MNVSKLTIQKMIAVSAMALAIPMSANASPDAQGDTMPHSEMHDHHKHGAKGMMTQMDLTAEQQMKVDQIMQKQRTEMTASMESRRVHREEMKSLVEQDTFDNAKAERLIKQQQDQERAAKLAMLRSQHEVYKVLTPEQREKAKVVRAEWKEKMKERYSNKAAKPASAM